MIDGFYFFFSSVCEELDADSGEDLVRRAFLAKYPYTTEYLVKIAIKEKDNAVLRTHNIATRWWAVHTLVKEGNVANYHDWLARYKLPEGSLSGFETEKWKNLSLQKCYGYNPRHLIELQNQIEADREAYRSSDDEL